MVASVKNAELGKNELVQRSHSLIQLSVAREILALLGNRSLLDFEGPGLDAPHNLFAVIEADT